VAAVAGGVNHGVLRAGGDAALQDRLERGEVAVAACKGKVVYKDNKLERILRQVVKQGGNVVQQRLFDLNEPQALGGVFVRDGLDGAGFSRARVAVEQDVVRGPAREQGLCVEQHVAALGLVAVELRELLRVGVADRDQRAALRNGEDMAGRKDAAAPLRGAARARAIEPPEVPLFRLPDRDGQRDPVDVAEARRVVGRGFGQDGELKHGLIGDNFVHFLLCREFSDVEVVVLADQLENAGRQIDAAGVERARNAAQGGVGSVALAGSARIERRQRPDQRVRAQLFKNDQIFKTGGKQLYFHRATSFLRIFDNKKGAFCGYRSFILQRAKKFFKQNP